MSFQVILYRDGVNTPWGFRLLGGTDVGHALTVQRVFYGSPADGEQGLRQSDVITRIGDKDATRMNHQQAHNTIKLAGNNLSLTVQRPGFQVPNQISQGHASPVGYYYYTLPRNVIANGSVDHRRRFVPMPPQNYPAALNEDVSLEKAVERHCITNQPHRTFPLITPGVKVKHDVPTGSYLRFVNEPYIVSYPESNIKTRVQDAVLNAARSAGSSPARSSTPEVFSGAAGPNAQVVNRQYNSPIHLYSTQNIVDTIAGQTGVTPILRKDGGGVGAGGLRIYDVTKSPTYRAICEDEWLSTKKRTSSGGDRPGNHPIQHPSKHQQQSYKPQNSYSIAGVDKDYVNSLGVPKDKVLQSKSFEMLQTVLSHETDF